MKKKTDISEKPYNRCLLCIHRTESRCDGPRTSSMPLDQWCEFMREMKEANGLTNPEVAEKSGVSLKTVERLMAQNSDQDIMRETARRIEDAIIGSSNQYPCFLAFEEKHPNETQKLNDALRDLERALDDNKDYRAALDNIHASYNAEMQKIRDQARKQVDFLMDNITRLRRDNDFLWAENNRKSKVVDTFLEKQEVLLTERRNDRFSNAQPAALPGSQE